MCSSTYLQCYSNTDVREGNRMELPSGSKLQASTRRLHRTATAGAPVLKSAEKRFLHRNQATARLLQHDTILHHVCVSNDWLVCQSA